MKTTIKFGEIMRVLSLFLTLGLFFVSIQAQNKLAAKDTEAIKQIEKNFESAWLKNDEKSVLALFWDDATLYPNGNTIKGIEGIKKFWFSPSDSIHTLSKYEIKLEDIYGERNLAYAIGVHDIAWTATTKGKMMPESLLRPDILSRFMLNATINGKSINAIGAESYRKLRNKLQKIKF
ncbi:MAG: nuclear transport factor 2 family protein [Blastocatellia bacterium]|nr:nuclear transport factor 2 family protein [Blastocatellia bacterium]